MGKLAKNIKHLRTLKGLTQEQLAIELNITKSRIGSYEEGRSEPLIDTLIEFSTYFKLPIDALVKNDLSLSSTDTFIDIGNQRVLFPIRVDENNDNVIEVVTKEASAGYLQGYTDTEFVANLPIMSLNFLPTGKHRAFPIKGDSMHPWVKDGDVVVCEYLESIHQVKNSYCYIILTKNDGLVYKRVFTDKIEEGYLTLSSDNKMYQPYLLHLSDVLEIWQFKLNLCIGQYQEDELNPASILNLMRSVGIELKDLKSRVGRLEE
ncbi:MAG: helix-turn-helix domain-containing protein [Flavobacteriales bacterium]|nr:helix-turn-helix domain-containing protein [Flavobacteriales bacterium]MCB9365519.1 helix-turn-helix domain-containing protein [Flavobacteriales bacterium]